MGQSGAVPPADVGHATGLPTCSGFIVLPATERAEFDRGFRDATKWLSIPIAIIAVLAWLLA